MSDLSESEIAGNFLQFFDFTVIEALGAVAIAADDVVMMMFLFVELKEGFSSLGLDTRDDACAFEGLQVSVNSDEIELLGTEAGVCLLSTKRLLAICQYLYESLSRLGDAEALLLESRYSGVEAVIVRGHLS